MKRKEFLSIPVPTPHYDAANWVKKEKIDYAVKLWQLVNNQPGRDFPSDKDLKELYAGKPDDEFEKELKELERQATEMKLKQHRKAHRR